MASFNVNKSKHAILSSGVVDTVTLLHGLVCPTQIVNRSAGDMYITTQVNVTDPIATPTVSGDNTLCIPGNSSITIVDEPTAVVKLIANSTVQYSVQALC